VSDQAILDKAMEAALQEASLKGFIPGGMGTSMVSQYTRTVGGRAVRVSNYRRKYKKARATLPVPTPPAMEELRRPGHRGGRRSRQPVQINTSKGPLNDLAPSKIRQLSADDLIELEEVIGASERGQRVASLKKPQLKALRERLLKDRAEYEARERDWWGEDRNSAEAQRSVQESLDLFDDTMEQVLRVLDVPVMEKGDEADDPGGALTLHRFGAIWDGFEHAGLRVEKAAADGYGDGEDATYTFSGLIVDRNGNNVGMIDRSMSWSDGRLAVNHELLEISGQAQRTGFATALNQHAEKEYRKLGVERIDIETAWVGGYAWARAGYIFAPYNVGEQDPAEIDWHKVGVNAVADILDEITRGRGSTGRGGDPYARSLDYIVETVPAAIEDQVQELVDNINETAINEEWDTPDAIAFYGSDVTWEENGKTMWLGKALMIGQHWDGVKFL
jgi:ribosomal protein S18 acetylase RimI-like enzyme